MCMAIYDNDQEAEVTGWNGPAYNFGGYDFHEGGELKLQVEQS